MKIINTIIYEIIEIKKAWQNYEYENGYGQFKPYSSV